MALESLHRAKSKMKCRQCHPSKVWRYRSWKVHLISFSYL